MPNDGTAVVHAVVVTADLLAAIAYYRDVLGMGDGRPVRHDAALLERLSGTTAPVADAVVLRGPGGGEIELVQFHEPSTAAASGMVGWHHAGVRSVTFAVDDLEQVLGRVEAAGYSRLGEVVTVPNPARDGDMSVVYVSAPDHVIVTLVSSLS